MRQVLLTRAGAGPHIVLRAAVPCVSRTDPAPHLPRSLTGLLSPAPVTGVIGEVAGIRLTLMYLYASLCMVRFLARSGMHARRPTLMGVCACRQINIAALFATEFWQFVVLRTLLGFNWMCTPMLMVPTHARLGCERHPPRHAHPRFRVCVAGVRHTAHGRAQARAGPANRTGAGVSHPRHDDGSTDLRTAAGLAHGDGVWSRQRRLRG